MPISGFLLTRSTKTPTLHRRRASPRSTTRAAERLVPDPPAYRHPSLPPLPRPASPFLWGVTTRPAQTICPFRPHHKTLWLKGKVGGWNARKPTQGAWLHDGGHRYAPSGRPALPPKTHFPDTICPSGSLASTTMASPDLAFLKVAPW